MSDKTSIEWTDSTWNPMRGCSRISPGCGGAKGIGGCYAEAIAERFSGPGQPFEGFATRGHGWTRKVSLVVDQLDTPLRWRKPRRIFVNSMSDTFHEGQPFEYIAAVFGVMALACHHTFQVLTKRAERMVEFFEWAPEQAKASRFADPLELCLHYAMNFGVASTRQQTIAIRKALPAGSPFLAQNTAPLWPLPNVWVGVSVEDQRRAEERIPHLLRVPAAVRFLSVEPQLEAIDLRKWLDGAGTECGPWCAHGFVSWVIAGGESGRGARPFDLAWARSLRDQCRAAGVAYFLKQLGAKPVVGGYPLAHPMLAGKPLLDSHGGLEAEWPTDLQGCRAFPEVRP